MVARINATPSLSIIDALDSLASQVRKNHKDVPSNIVIILASGRTGRGSKHGHFAPESWEGNHEILISGESLARGAEATFGTLIHELAHATAQETGVRDTSNNGRYHNKRFKAIAEPMGISLAEAGTIGWSVTTLKPETALQYSAGLAKLAASLTTHRKGFMEPQAKVAAERNKTKGKIVCECNDPVTVSLQWFERNAINLHCLECQTYYQITEEE